MSRFQVGIGGWKRAGQFLLIHQPIPTRNQDTYQERILIKLYWHNVSLLFNQTYIYIYISSSSSSQSVQVYSTVRSLLTFFCYLSLSSNAHSKSSIVHLFSSQSWYKLINSGQPTLVRPCTAINKRISLMNLSSVLQQSPGNLVRLTWMISQMGSWRVYTCFFWSVPSKICSRKHVPFLFSFHLVFSTGLVSDHVVHPCGRMNRQISEIVFIYLSQFSHAGVVQYTDYMLEKE